MAYFPFFMDVGQMEGLIVGGGPVALRKALRLLEWGARLRVVAPKAEEGFLALERKGTLFLELRAWRPKDLEGADFVVAASSDRELNRQVAGECRRRGILFNTADGREAGGFLFPALVREGPVTVGICTGGASPVLAASLKERVREALPPGTGAAAECLGQWRGYVRERIGSQKEREAAFRALFEAAMDRGGAVSPEQAEEIVNRYCLAGKGEGIGRARVRREPGDGE